MVHIPLSLNTFPNNFIEKSTSSPVSITYRYPEASRCEQISSEAQQRLGEIRRQYNVASKKGLGWLFCACITLLGLRVAIKYPSPPRSSPLFFIISVIFFFAICLPMLVRVFMQVRNGGRAEDEIYQQAERLINDISQKLHELYTIFPTAVIHEGKLTADFKITKDLNDNLDRWIDSLRIIHGWDTLAHSWPTDQQSFRDTNEWQRHYFVEETFSRLSTNLADIVQKIEDSRENIKQTLQSESQESPHRTETCRILLNELLCSVRNFEQREQDLRNEAASLRNAYSAGARSRHR